ncbi:MULTISPECIES: fumarylacetoacetate hydrolase family protein [Burkholderia]|uniref:fumarylacetoacetate hydrolase family protein n=1 Tax=Burkholderia TaxID=32008 RepID=UPI00068440F3|nr:MULTISPECIES: fumarylacetoacetate hydrolase family protein [Burkholderia]MBA9948202.1 fumarylacetoacetate hydrolase family protein [Burkholderia cepacia]MBA9978326.1 fumarylacetoacetate hydrolase family protein [Burkholderia cepacia]MBA9996313.1 fumarylacetoacetate hydrolase family protein [Burkholderia cepacia]MBB0004199.1 fumarylacetoacetate hydrolase family protein [Burkholderia cepacia]MBB0011905.1 fumarylacetoacetate hydrolase family protein [Burkholderia cepacia]
MSGLKRERGFALAYAKARADAAQWFVVVGERAVPLSDLAAGRLLAVPLDGAAALDRIFSDWDALIRQLTVLDSLAFRDVQHEGWVPVEQLDLLAPVSPGANIYCSAANYRRQLVELIITRGGDPEIDRLPVAERRPVAERMVEKRSRQGEPYFFMRPNSGIAAPSGEIRVEAGTTELDWELELGVVIGRRARHVGREEAGNYVAAFLILNDVTDRSLIYRKDFPGADWLRGKGMPDSMPAGPYLVPASVIGEIAALRLRLSVNGEVMQDELAGDMILDVPRLIEYLSSRVELRPGDVIATGTPAGTGAERGRFLRDGDVIKAEIDGLGCQTSRIVFGPESGLGDRP